MLKLTYHGKRFGVDNKFFYKYVDSTGKDWAFNKQLGDFTRLGDIIECVQTEKGVKAPYNVIGNDSEIVESVSVEQAIAIQMQKAYSISKKPCVGSIDELIELVKRNTSSSADRKRIALYIMTKLI